MTNFTRNRHHEIIIGPSRRGTGALAIITQHADDFPPGFIADEFGYYVGLGDLEYLNRLSSGISSQNRNRHAPRPPHRGLRTLRLI